MMDSRKRGKRWKGRRGGGGDFWHAWREQWRISWNEQDHPGPPNFPPPRPMHGEIKANHWRRFFHDFMGTWPEHHWAFGGRRFNPWLQGADEFNPFLASVLSMGGGLLPIVVLHLLAIRPRYGNEIMDLISQRTARQWLANPGAVYPLLTMLEQQSLVAGRWEDPHKRTIRIYRLTEVGRSELARLTSIIRPKLEEAIEVLLLIVDDLDDDILET